MGATSKRNRSAKGGTRSSLQYEGEGVLIHPPHQGVCGRHGTEEWRVTSGGLAGSPGGTGVSRLISESEIASDALSVDGRLCNTRSATKAARPGNRRQKFSDVGTLVVVLSGTRRPVSARTHSLPL